MKRVERFEEGEREREKREVAQASSPLGDKDVGISASTLE